MTRKAKICSRAQISSPAPGHLHQALLLRPSYASSDSASSSALQRPSPFLNPQKVPEDWQCHEFNLHLEHKMRPDDRKMGIDKLINLADDNTRDQTPVEHNLPA